MVAACISIGSARSTLPEMGKPVAPWGPLGATMPLQILPQTLALVLGMASTNPHLRQISDGEVIR